MYNRWQPNVRTFTTLLDTACDQLDTAKFDYLWGLMQVLYNYHVLIINNAYLNNEYVGPYAGV